MCAGGRLVTTVPTANAGRSRSMPRGPAGRRAKPKKKLTCRDRAAKPCRCHKHCSGGDRPNFHGVVKLSQAFDQACFLLVGGTAIEVIAAEVLIHGPVLEQVIDGGKD